MKRISITVDEQTANLLKGKVNKSETIRKALEVYNGDVSTDTLAGMREAFRRIEKKLDEIEIQILALPQGDAQNKSPLKETPSENKIESNIEWDIPKEVSDSFTEMSYEKNAAERIMRKING